MTSDYPHGITSPAAVPPIINAERRLEAVLNNASVAIFLLDTGHSCSYMNTAAEELTGYTLGEAVGRRLHELVHHTRPDGSFFPIAECPINHALPGNKLQGEDVFVRKDGRFIPVAYTSSPIVDNGSIVGTIIEARDITSEKRAIEDLQVGLRKLGAETHALEVLNETAALIAAELDVETVVQRVVDAGVDLTEARFGAFFYTVEQANGDELMLYKLAGAEISDFDQLATPRATKVFGPTFNGEGVVRSDNILKDPRYGHNLPHQGMPDGHLPVRSYLAVPVTSQEGEVVGGLFFGHPEEGVFNERSEKLAKALAAQAAIALTKAKLFQDVQDTNHTLEQRIAARTQELHKANESLRHAQKMEAFGQLAGGIAHDFNHVLTVVLSATEILRTQKLNEADRLSYLDDVAQTATRAAGLTSQLLTFARRKTLEPGAFDVVERLMSVASMLDPLMGNGIRIEVRSALRPCYAFADADEFETAIVNMCLNAKDAMGTEGELTIDVSVVGADELVPNQDGSTSKRNLVKISVTDTGAGIDPADIDRVFEPFFTTKPLGEGTGLGLAQVFGFAKQSGGEVSVCSEKGNGTTINLYLPEVEDAPTGAR